jgi:hypothetical protein
VDFLDLRYDYDCIACCLDGCRCVAAGGTEIEYAAGIRVAGFELFGWLGLAVLLGVLGVFRPALDQPIPYIAFAIAFPIIIGAWFIFRTVSGSELVRNTQQSWLIAVQSFRGLGSMFLVLNGTNFLPPEFAIPAGFGDAFVGVLAVPIAAYFWSGLPGRKALAVALEYFGIDLVVAVATGSHLSNTANFWRLTIPIC